jgi:hypothetical protein
MSKGDTFENDLLKLIFQATTIANIANNASASPLTSLFIALHTSSPADTGLQNTNETSYTSYARASILRASGAGGSTITGNSMSPTDPIDFPEGGVAASGTITHFSVGVASSGATKILYWGTVTPNIVMAQGVTPRLSTATTITED